MNKLKKEIKITPAYDKRHSEPLKNHGICACRVFFVVKGKEGAITFNFYTNWYLPETEKEYRDKEKVLKTNKLIGSWDIHSKEPLFKDQEVTIEDCEFLGQDCYCDGSCLKADRYIELLIRKGSEAVFKKLEEDYRREFMDED